MNIVLGSAVPLALLAVFVFVRWLQGKAPKRYALNVVVASMLLVYFLITASLGIFWVANQELPVFDLHYLFGYLTLLLVATHVAINFKPLLRFTRSRAPRQLLASDGRRYRPSIRIFGKVVALIAFGAFCYWVGYGEGSTTLEVREGGQVVAPQHASRGTQVGPLREPQPVRRQWVAVDGVEEDLADFYHRRTRHSRIEIMARRGGLDWSMRPIVFKEYPEGPMVALSRDHLDVSKPTGASIEAYRAEVLAISDSSISQQELTTLLHLTNGITATKRYPRITYSLRSAPSAGALYPTITYVLVNRVDGLSSGIYHYDVEHHALRLIRDDPGLADELANVSASAHLIRQAPVTFMFTTEFFRSSWKYRERSWRYCLLDAGHLAVQTMVAGSAMGFGSRPVGRFDDAEVNALLDIDFNEEAAVLLLPLGRLEDEPPKIAERVFVSKAQDLQSDRVERLITLAHGRTSLSAVGDERVTAFDMAGPQRIVEGGQRVKLPKSFLVGDALGPTILRRRSARRWSGAGMSLQQFSSVLYYSFGFGDSHNPSIENNHALRFYVNVHKIEGVAPGTYAYAPHEHALYLLRDGDMRSASHAMGLFQEVVRDADAALIMTIDPSTMEYPDGSRGYRYATMDAGMFGGLVYLQTVALGLGCTGIGAFFDDEVSEVISRRPEDEHIIYMMAIGSPSGGP